MYVIYPKQRQLVVQCAALQLLNGDRGCGHLATAATVAEAFTKITEPVSKETKP